MIREGKSTTLVREMLLDYLPEKNRHTEEGGNVHEGAEAVPTTRGAFELDVAKRRGAFSTHDQAKIKL